MADEENLKKLIFQSQYVLEDYEETKEKMAKYRELLYKEFPEEYKKMIQKQNQGAISDPPLDDKPEQTQELSEEYEPEERTKSPSMRKLYRRISKITHPDKVDSEFLNSYFKRASTAYSENNVGELFTIAAFLNIDTSDVDKDQIINELKSDIFTKQFFISNTKSSIAWRWANAKSDKEKDQIRQIIKEFVEENY